MGTELNEFQGNVVPPSLKWIATERRPESSAASARYLHRCVQRILFFIAAKSSTPEVYCTACEAIVCAGIFVPAWPEKGYQTHEFYRPKRKPGPMYFPKTTYLLQLSKGQLHDAFDLQQAGRQAKQRRRGGMRFRKKRSLENILPVRTVEKAFVRSYRKRIRIRTRATLYYRCVRTACCVACVRLRACLHPRVGVRVRAHPALCSSLLACRSFSPTAHYYDSIGFSPPPPPQAVHAAVPAVERAGKASARAREHAHTRYSHLYRGWR